MLRLLGTLARSNKLNADALNSIAENIRAYLDAKHRARERALALTREVIRLSANAIRNVHRRNFAVAEELLSKARANLDETETLLAEHRDIHHAGFVHDSQKEYAEASCTLALIAGRALPGSEEIGVMAGAYLNGLGETVGELRRHLLDSLRAGDIAHCEETLGVMGDIYDVLVTMDYPEAVTGGLRRTADAMRGILERTRGDFTTTYMQRRLEDRLRELEERLSK
ncbi:MAG: haloacid dehalogenase [Chloroflexota bacterium]|nr:haloacid dehalogenase [Chloroflexota bacterium]